MKLQRLHQSVAQQLENVNSDLLLGLLAILICSAGKRPTGPREEHLDFSSWCRFVFLAAYANSALQEIARLSETLGKTGEGYTNLQQKAQQIANEKDDLAAKCNDMMKVRSNQFFP